MSAKQRQGLTFAFVGLVDIFFAATAVVIILIITLSQQIQPPTYIPQTDLILVCHDETNDTIELRYGETTVAVSDLRSLLQQFSSRPTLRIQILFHAKSTKCYENLKEQFKKFNQEIDRSHGLPFIIYSGQVVPTPSVKM
jgi:hypothetical protein